jgi:hypothetical protein
MPSAATFKLPSRKRAGGVLRQTYTPLDPLFLEGNQKRLKFLNIKGKKQVFSGRYHDL